MTKAVSGIYRDFAGIIAVYRRFSATAEFYALVRLVPLRLMETHSVIDAEALPRYEETIHQVLDSIAAPSRAVVLARMSTLGACRRLEQRDHRGQHPPQ